MKSVRVQPLSNEILLVGIVCDCGLNVLNNETTKERNFKHQIAVGATYNGGGPIFVCDCKKRYQIISQSGHIHINELAH